LRVTLSLLRPFHEKADLVKANLVAQLCGFVTASPWPRFHPHC